MLRLKGEDAIHEAIWFLGEHPIHPKVSFYAS